MVIFLLLMATSLKQTVLVIQNYRHEQSVVLQPASHHLPLHELHAISHWHLFGIYQADALDPEALPKTNLNLTLVGIMAATPEQASQVIIAVSGGEEKVYRQGDLLPGGAKIYKILKARVVLTHDGHYENLTLPEPALTYEPTPTMLPLSGQDQ